MGVKISETMVKKKHIESEDEIGYAELQDEPDKNKNLTDPTKAMDYNKMRMNKTDKIDCFE